MNINKDSRIIEVFSTAMRDEAKVEKAELKDANEYVKDLASRLSPENRYEIAQIMRILIDEDMSQRVQYLDLIADVKHTGFGEKAQFEVAVDDIKAFFQAKSSTTQRSKISSKYFTLDTDEVSVRPVVNFLDLQLGRVNMANIALRASARLELEIVKRVQQVVYDAFSTMSSPNYAANAGLTAATVDPLINAMSRVGGKPVVIGDIELLSKFTALTGFNSNVADAYMVEHNENGMIGTYKGAKLVKLVNPLVSNSVSTTELRKDLAYIIPTGTPELSPIKVQFEGGLQAIESGINMNSKEIEFRFDQYVGVASIGVRKLMAVYRDTNL